MTCFNLQIGDRTYKFVNNDFSFGESENSLQGWDSFVSFLTTGDLHGGKLIDDSGNVIEDISEFFNSAIETLRDCGDAIMQLHPKDGITASGGWLIDHIVGNKKFGNYGQNVFLNKNWGQTTWYGFSKNRGVIVGGYINRQHASLLFRLYEDIKSGNGIVKSMIEKLYVQHQGQDSSDIWTKLTWVVNSQLNTLIPSLDAMYSENKYIRKNIRTIRSEIRKADKVAQFKNQYAVVNSVPYIILGKASEVNDRVKVVDMEGKVQSIEVDSISKVGRTKQLIHKGEIYFKIENSWYKQIEKGNKTVYIKVDSTKDKKELNKIFLGLSDVKIIDWRTSKDRLMLGDLKENVKKKLISLAQFEGISIQTNLGTFTSNGEAFVDMDGNALPVESNPRVEMIYIPNKIVPEIYSKKYSTVISKLEPPVKEVEFSYSQIRLGLYELCGITDHSVIKKDFNLKSNVQIVNTQNGLLLKINGNYKTKYNGTFITEVLNAGKFFKFALEHQEELMNIMGDFSFNKIYRLWKDNKLSEEAPEVYAYMLNNFKDKAGNAVTFVSDNLSEDLQNIIDENDLEDVKSKMGNVKLDSIIETLIKKGLYIYSCEL